MTEPAAALDVLIQRLRDYCDWHLARPQDCVCPCCTAADTLAAQAALAERLSTAMMEANERARLRMDAIHELEAQLAEVTAEWDTYKRDLLVHLAGCSAQVREAFMAGVDYGLTAGSWFTPKPEQAFAAFLARAAEPKETVDDRSGLRLRDTNDGT